MTDENGFLRPEAFQARVAEIKANKTVDGYGPALAKAFDALPDVQKPSFLFASKDIDPLRKAFGAGHAITSTLLTVGTTVPAFVIGNLMRGSAFAPLVIISASSIGVISGLNSCLQRAAYDDQKIPYRMMDVEYAMWRMTQVEKAEIAPIRALGAGLLNGFKHNAVSMTARVLASVVGGAVYSLVKGASILSRGLFGSSEISSVTRRIQSADDKLLRAAEAIPGKSYCLAKDATMPLATERLMAIRDAAYIRRNHRVACLGPDA